MIKKLTTAVFAAGALLVAACAQPTAEAPKADIVDTAIAADDFNTLVAAVQAAGTVENLLKPENKDQLVAVLTYHVVPGKVMSADIAGKKLNAATVQGQSVAIDATSGVMVNDATVVAADVEASNGVIHVIDKVILPGG